MTQNHFIKTSFFLRKTRAKPNGETPIYLRISINGKFIDVSTKKMIHANKWNNQAECIKGNREEVRIINEDLTSLKNRVQTIFNKCQKGSELVTAELIRDILVGKGVKQKSLIEVFGYHNSQMNELIGKTYSKGTMERYKTSLMLTKLFIKHAYNKEDLYLSDLKYPFITDFEYYLKTERGNCHNTAVKYIKNFKKIIKLAVNNEWLDKDPFTKYSNPLTPVKRDPLTTDELKLIEEKGFTNPRVEIVRDIFLFSCYTGLAYTDVKKLKGENIAMGFDRNLWLNIQRTKTDSECRIPLLPQALELIEKYKDNHEALNTGFCFPVKSNQKMNEYLKEIAGLCGITKPLTYHIARHTFATTVTMTKGVSIETVSAMLGHKNIRTTQIYSKIVGQKISEEMEKLKNVNKEEIEKLKISNKEENMIQKQAVG